MQTSDDGEAVKNLASSDERPTKRQKVEAPVDETESEEPSPDRKVTPVPKQRVEHLQMTHQPQQASAMEASALQQPTVADAKSAAVA